MLHSPTILPKVSNAYRFEPILVIMSQLPPETVTIAGTEILSDKVSIINAICNNCNKRFKSTRAVTMHLKVAGKGHAVTFIDYGNYDKNTGILRHMKRVRK